MFNIINYFKSWKKHWEIIKLANNIVDFASSNITDEEFGNYIVNNFLPRFNELITDTESGDRFLKAVRFKQVIGFNRLK